MTVYISLLRGINVGGNNLVKMEALRALYEKLKFRDVVSYVQSGNVVFRAAETDRARIAGKIEDAIERAFGHRPRVILRSTAELRDVVARNPFAARTGIEPGKLVVTFLAGPASDEARVKLAGLPKTAEEMHLHRCEMFTYFPDGMGKTKLSLPAVDRALKVAGTARNWNTVNKLLAIAEGLEGNG